MLIRLTDEEQRMLDASLRELRKNKLVLRMKEYIQHGSVTTYDHCERVAKVSLWLNRRMHLGADEKALIRGAMLHDFYLYDWHDDDGGAHRLHGFTHPARAAKNAKKHFDISRKEEGIIRSHMWPLTLRAVPSSREAAIVCMADKICSLHETVARR